MKTQLSLPLLLYIVLIEGFVTISVEMLTIRQLIPVVGNSVVVTSLIIGVFLLFLAYGYRKGGLCTANYLSVLANNFRNAAFLLGIGLSYIFINQFFYILQTLGAHIFFSLIIYLLLLIAPLVYVLGQTVPITIKLFKEEHAIGSVSGTVLHLSTIGSFLGSVLTTLLFMNYLGIAWTIVINFLLMISLASVVTLSESKDLKRLFGQGWVTSKIILFAIGACIFSNKCSIDKGIKIFLCCNFKSSNKSFFIFYKL